MHYLISKVLSSVFCNCSLILWPYQKCCKTDWLPSNWPNLDFTTERVSPEEVTLAKAWPDELKLKKLDDDLLGDEDDYDDEDYYDEDYDEDEEDDELYDDEEYYGDDYKDDDKEHWK